jgi:hypothetical protein
MLLGADEQVRRWWSSVRRSPAAPMWLAAVVVGLLGVVGAYVIPRVPWSGPALFVTVIVVTIPTLTVALARASKDKHERDASTASLTASLKDDHDAWAKHAGKLEVWRELDQDIQALHGLGHYLAHLGDLHTAEEAIDFWYDGLTGRSHVRTLLDLWMRLGRPSTYHDLPAAAKAHPDFLLLEKLEGIDVREGDELVYGAATQARLGDEWGRIPLPVDAADFAGLGPERVAVIANNYESTARIYSSSHELDGELRTRWPAAAQPTD